MAERALHLPLPVMEAPDSHQPGLQLFWLFVLAIPVATVAWTITHEEVFREPRDFCVRRSRSAASLLARKFFYLFTCEYCFSHYVTLFFLILTGYRFLLDDWRGYIISFFAVVWIANLYMSLYVRLRVDIRGERTEIEQREKVIEEIDTKLQQQRNDTH